MSPRESSLEQALARAGDGAFVVTDDGRITLWNQAAARILGYTAREAVGRRCCELFVGRDDDGNRLCYTGCHVMTLVQMGDPVQNFDMQTQAKTGRSLWLNVSVIAIPDGGNGARTIHLFRDVTASKELLKLVAERASPPSTAAASGGELTRRELEILRLVAGGANTTVIAQRLNVSPATVRNHVQNILGKLGVHSRLEAAAYAASHRLL